MKLLSIITILSITTTSLAFRFGTYYDKNGEYIGPNADLYLQPPKYSWEYPIAYPSNVVYRQRYYPRTPEGDAPIIKYSNSQNSDGDYSYEYITGNNIHTKQTGYNNNGENVVRGSYSYVGPDGKTYTTHYIADRNGYRAYGAHLPTQPEELATPARRRYYVADRDYISSTFLPPVVTVTPKPVHHISSPNFVEVPVAVTTRRPAESVVIIPQPKSYLTPPSYKTYSYSPAILSDVNQVVISSTPTPYYSTTVRPFYSTTLKK